MQERLSKCLNRLSPSATLAMSAKSAEMTAQGIDVVNMSIGEPDFDTPAHIIQAAKDAMDQGFTRYPPVPGYPSLRKTICEKFARENGLEYTPSQIVVSTGAKQGLCNALMSILDPGDEVIIPAPYWVSYPQMVNITGATPVYIHASIDQGFKITPAQLEAAITPATRLIIICTPSNPSGAVYSREELEGLAAVVLRHERVMVLADEIYEHISYCGPVSSIASVPGMQERTIIINGVSKAYAMTGWRIGYMAAPAWIAAACSKLQGQYTSGTSSIGQKAAEAALSGPQDCVEHMRQAFERRRDLFVSLMKQIPGLGVTVPDGAFYLLPDVSAYLGRPGLESGSDLAMYLLEDCHVATVGGEAFGAPGCIRLSYACSEEQIREAVSRISTALSKL